MKKMKSHLLLLCLVTVITASLILSPSFVSADDGNLKIPDKQRQYEERLKEIAEQGKRGVNWEKILPQISNNLEDRLGCPPESGVILNPDNIEIADYISGSDNDYFNSQMLNEWFSSWVDFQLFAIGLTGSLDTYWYGDNPHWYTDKITMIGQYVIGDAGATWILGDDSHWQYGGASYIALWSDIIYDDYYISFSFDDLGVGRIYPTTITEYQNSWHYFEDEETTIHLYCWDSCFG